MSNIISSKVKFMRNFKGISFNTNTNAKALNDVLKLSLDACKQCGLKAEALGKINNEVLTNLVDTSVLEKDFVRDIKYKGCATNDNVTIQINGINHIEIFSSDNDIFNAYNNAKTVDKMLCNKLNFLYSDRYGFLTPELDKIGCGMQSETLVVLPALTQTNAIKNLPQYCDKLGFKIYQISDKNSLYLIVSNTSLGYTEKQICELTSQYVNNVIKCEIEVCKKLATDKLEIMDKSVRAKAIINSCLKITRDELFKLIGDILISVNAGLEDNNLSNKINNIFKTIKNKNLNNCENLAKLIKNNLN